MSWINHLRIFIKDKSLIRRLRLKDVVAKVERGTWFPLSCILKELVEIVPVALRVALLFFAVASLLAWE